MRIPFDWAQHPVANPDREPTKRKYAHRGRRGHYLKIKQIRPLLRQNRKTSLARTKHIFKSHIRSKQIRPPTGDRTGHEPGTERHQKGKEKLFVRQANPTAIRRQNRTRAWHWNPAKIGPMSRGKPAREPTHKQLT